MKLTKLQKFSWIGCPWLFGVVLLITSLVIPAGEQPIIKALYTGFALLLLSVYGINSLLARLVEKSEASGQNKKAGE